LAKARHPFAYSVLAKANEFGRSEITAEHADVYSFRHLQRESAKKTYGYDVVRNGVHAGYCSDEYNLIPSSVGANFDSDTYSWLREQEGNDRLLTALSWYVKSCRRDADDLDQVIALSVAFEALLDLPNSKNGAAYTLRRLLRDAGIDDARRIALAARNKGLLVSFVSRRFRSRIRKLTGSAKIAGYAKDLYATGSGIRHGDPLFRGQVAWFGKHGHLHRPGFGRLLFSYLVREMYGRPQAGEQGLATWEAVRRVDRERMERMLGSDRERFDKVKAILAGGGTAEEKLSGLLRQSDFLRDRSVTAGERADFLDALKQTIQLAREHDAPALSRLSSEAAEVLAIRQGAVTELKAGEICFSLSHKALDRSPLTLGTMVLFPMAEYCAHLHGYG